MAGPIGITNTHAVGARTRAIIDWTVTHHPALAQAWLLPVVGRDLGRLPQRHQRRATSASTSSRRSRRRRAARSRRAPSAAAPG